MIPRSPRAAGVLLAAVAAALLAPRAGAAASLGDAARATGAIEDRLAFVEKAYDGPDESMLDRARRKYAEGETQFLLGDWDHAAILITAATETPEFRATPDYPRALAYLGDAFRSAGACDSALLEYDALLALGDTPARPGAVLGALDCRVRLRRLEGVDALVAEARRLVPGGAPPEVGYLAGKAIFFRTDLRPSDRLQRGLAAFEAVRPPYHVAAAYFEGALLVEAGDLRGAAARFERCRGLPGNDPRQTEIRELCGLALGRVYGALGMFAESLDRYQSVPLGSPRFDEALFEIAWNFVKAKRYEQALRTASMIVDLAPGSHLAPEATILTGHLDLELGHFAAATEAFDKVINTYAPIRDEIDAILTMQEDPVRYFDELIGRKGRAFDVASILPPIAVKWATAQRDVEGALDLVAGLDGARRDLDGSSAMADRIDGLLARESGLDASPLLEAGWASADAVETAAARLQGEIVGLEEPAALRGLPPDARAQLERVHDQREGAQRRLAALPATPDEVGARQERMTGRIDQVDRAAFQLDYQVDAAAAAVAATEAWFEQHRGEIRSDDAARTAFGAQIREQRQAIAGYRDALAGLHREVLGVRDAARGSQELRGEAELRREFHDRLWAERTLLAAARPALSGDELADLARAEGLLDRLDQVDGRALRLKERFAGLAARRAGALRAQLEVARGAIAEERGATAAVSADASSVVGRIAFRSFSAVRAQFYRLVLKADVGIIDVAWSRKRERVERIQQLASQEAAELEALDRDYRLVLEAVQ